MIFAIHASRIDQGVTKMWAMPPKFNGELQPTSRGSSIFGVTRRSKTAFHFSLKDDITGILMKLSRF
ncbi:hypothetical protein WN51_13317 [Melipona quadrifasciata]|uniref:Uncharacterized protein n=1 Tax=Melipona quadrifasciata TaxID=166423 RepID=A0A0M9A2T3_9HYME|nr:hypothetical protein WN51_13317 [Melipona quadrifasciata]